MKLIVTGVTGFIGSKLVPKLIEENHEIGVIVRDSSDLSRLPIDRFCSLYQISTYADIHRAFSEFQPDAVIHLATMYVNQHTPEDIPAIMQSNLVFGTQILEAMQQNGVYKILNLGTRWQHLQGIRDYAANLYAASKNAFQNILQYYHYNHDFAHTTLELCDTFGRGDPRKKIVELMVQACRDRSALSLSPGGQVLDLLCVDDLTAFIGDCLRNDKFFKNDTWCISGEEIRLKDLGDVIEELYGVSGYLKWGEKSYREHELMHPPVFSEVRKIARDTLENHLVYQYIKEK